MPPSPEITIQPHPRIRRSGSAEPLRRPRAAAQGPGSGRWRKALDYLLLFVTVVLVVDGLVGEKGLMDTMRARQQSAELAAKVQQLKDENRALRDRARKLDKDPATIEMLAREELGLIRPGEVLFILKDVRGR
jgi:cell division protein FtsB